MSDLLLTILAKAFWFVMFLSGVFITIAGAVFLVLVLLELICFLVDRILKRVKALELLFQFVYHKEEFKEWYEINTGKDHLS